jgi:hypothetical protein
MDKIRLDMLDYPTAWEIQRRGVEHTDPRCSAVQTDGGMLCDCGAVQAAWEKHRAADAREQGTLDGLGEKIYRATAGSAQSLPYNELPASARAAYRDLVVEIRGG